MKEKALTISIVTWNSSESIKDCLESLIKQTYSDYNIVIVDNNSHDDTCKIINDFNHPSIYLIPLKENTGFCGGHNYIINRSDSDFILLVNPDARLYPDYIEKAMIRMSKGQEIGTVCGLLIQTEVENNALIDSAGMTLKKDGRFKVRFHGKPIMSVDLKYTEVSGADGALPLYRKKMIEDVKINGEFFDEMFFAHKEDWDVSWRSGLLGWKTVFDPACIAIHPRSFKPGSLNTRKKMSAIIKFHAVKNQLMLICKNEQNILKNIFYIMPRQIMVFFFILFFERNSLQAYSYILRNRKKILESRKLIRNKIELKKNNYF